MYKRYIKRTIDFVVALVGLLLAMPLVVTTTLILCVANGGKVFFVQDRPGKGGKIFQILKFKTMRDAWDEEGKMLPDAQRMTKVGSIVRKLSIDELPQLMNVLKGDMSLIGPRPLLVEYLPLYSAEQMRRHDMRPGITGWAQVNGRNAISHTQKFEYDVWYVDNISIALDWKILVMTVGKVFKASGISTEGRVTAEKFNGKN